MGSRKNVRSITIDSNIRCLRVYPIQGTKKNVDDLKTIGIKLDKEQAIKFSRVLLAATEEWETIDITAYRTTPRKKDGTYQVTITSVSK